MSAIEQLSWRTRLARDLSWWLVIKIALLTVLWGLFFSGSHQCRVDGSAAADRFGFGPMNSSGGERCD
jgi:hypothetical protein